MVIFFLVVDVGINVFIKVQLIGNDLAKHVHTYLFQRQIYYFLKLKSGLKSEVTAGLEINGIVAEKGAEHGGVFGFVEGAFF